MTSYAPQTPAEALATLQAMTDHPPSPPDWAERERQDAADARAEHRKEARRGDWDSEADLDRLAQERAG